MEETEIQLLTIPSETLSASYGLHIRMFSTLRTYRGSIHWHLNKSDERGTLELTFWPAGKRAWFSV